ncbi:MAG: HAMP domain-containing histidine kinase, partial [Myxococcales bacterium]|nr:HAMP domain-containing histidine kinase [Myxococcales bacterium]
HELRTPLNTITGFCHLLAADPDLQPEQAEDVQAIAEGAAQLLGHVDEILDLGQIEAGQVEPLALEPVDLGGLARRVAARLGKGARVPVGVQVAEALPPVLADPRRIQQIVENLVGNAVKFTRTGRIDVVVDRYAPPAVSLRVSDTGPGIDAAELDAVFDEFYRVQSQRTVAGTGLGLPIARRLAERHGGRLWAESEPGVGSTFHLELPIEGPA